MKKPRKVAIYKARGMGKLRSGGIVFPEEFICNVKTSPAKNRIIKKKNQIQIEYGQKAIAKAGSHQFEVGQEITFVEMIKGLVYSSLTIYNFTGIHHGAEISQHLTDDEFELIQDPNVFTEEKFNELVEYVKNTPPRIPTRPGVSGTPLTK